jgi:hypothetical protein
MNRESFVSPLIGEFLAFLKAAQSMNEFAKQITESPAMKAVKEMADDNHPSALAINAEVKRLTESPAMKAMKDIADNHHKQMEALTRYARSTRGRIEMALYRKENKGEQLATLVAKVLDGFFLAQMMAKVLPGLSKFAKRKSGRARVMALRGLALSCAPNLFRKSDKLIISRAIPGIA